MNRLKRSLAKIYKKFRTGRYYTLIMKKIYRLVQLLLPINKKLIVFESNVGKGIGDSPKAIYDYLQTLDLDYHYVWISEKKVPAFGMNTKIVSRFGIQYYYYLARANYWVNNQNFPTDLVKRSGTTYLQTWHGTPLKKMQNDLDKIIGRNATYLERVNHAVTYWDYLVSPSPYATKCFRSAFDYQKEVLEVGYPRNDIFYKSTVELESITTKVKQRLGIADDNRQVLLYAPTFRDDALKSFQLELDLKAFMAELADDYILLIRAHVATAQQIKIPKQYSLDVIDVSFYPDIQELYLVSDMCITDYSSVMFDFAHTKKPLLFFTYDLDHYQETLRGFYIDFVNEAPGPLSRTTAELITDIKRIATEPLSEKYNDFYAKYCGIEDGTSSKQVAEAVFAKVKTAKKKTALEMEKQGLSESNLEENQKVELSHSATEFLLKTEAKGLMLKGKNYEENIPVSNGCYRIAFTRILELLNDKEETIKIVTNEGTPWEMINISQVGIMAVEYQGQECYLFETADNKLAIQVNKLPSVMNFHQNHRVREFKVNKDQVTLQLEIITKYAPVKVFELETKIRHSQKKQAYRGEVTSYTKVGRKSYRNQVSCTFNLADILELNQQNQTAPYFIPSFDFYFSMDVTGYETKRAFQRIISEDLIEEGVIFSEKRQGHLVIQSYAAQANQGLSIKLIEVASKTFEKFLKELPAVSQDELKHSETELSLLFFDYIDIKALEQVNKKELIIGSQDQGFFIKSATNFGQLFLEAGNKLLPIEKNEFGYYIPTTLIDQGSSKDGGLIKIVTNNRQQLRVTDAFKVMAENQSYLTNNKHSYFIYRSVDNCIRVSRDKAPSPKSYYKNHELDEVTSQAGDMHLNLTIRTEVFPLASINGLVKLRGNQQRHEALGAVTQMKELANGVFEHQVNIVLTADVMKAVASELNQNYYSYDIFDFFFTFEVAEQPLMPTAFRISCPNLPKDTAVISNGEDEVMVIHCYPTKNTENLSAKMTLINRDVNQYYIDYKDQASLVKNPKPIILVNEYPHKAQDTGLAYFKYLVDNHQDTYDSYYLISKESKDLGNLEGYFDNVVFYKTKEHVEVFVKADILASSHGTNYATPVVDSYSKGLLAEKYKVFLQHGILGVRNMAHLYRKDPENPFTNLFITSSNREKELVMRDFDYTDEDVIVSGLSRFDVLFSRENQLESSGNKKILIMPSWRENLDTKPKEVFKESIFYERFDKLLNSKEFEELAKEKNWEVSLYLHTNFQKFSSCFNSKFVTVVAEGDKTVQELLIESDLLITDYSSVGLDFALREKPIIYYQFDAKINNTTEQLTTDFFPGEIKISLAGVLDELRYFASHPEMRSQHVAKLDNLYLHRDCNANNRIFAAMTAGLEKRNREIAKGN